MDLLSIRIDSEITSQLHKIIWKGGVGVLKSLYSGTSKRFTLQFSSIPQRSPLVTSHVTHKTYKNPQL